MVDEPFVPARGMGDWRHPPFLTRHSGRERGFLTTRPGKLRAQARQRHDEYDCLRLVHSISPGTPVLKPPVPVDLDTLFVATRDGLVLARGECEDDSAGWLEGLQTLGGSMCVVAVSSYQYTPLENVLLRANSFCMPIRKGTPFQIRRTNALGNPRAWAYFCELLQPMAFPGAMEALSPCTLYTARKDGFLLAHIRAVENGAGNEDQGSSGSIEVHAWPDSEMPSADGLMETASTQFHRSGRWLRGNSVLMPMPAGNRFRVDLKNPTGTNQVQVWWMALATQA